MNSTASIRRQSTIDHMGAATVTTTTTAATNVPQFHSSGRPTLIMTSSAQSRRLSVAMSGGHLVTPNKAYENSYRTEPDKPFPTGAARRVMREVMETMLDGRLYDSGACRQLTTALADAIKSRVKELGHPRYKLVTNVAIGQATDTSVALSSRCVWNERFDSFAQHTYRNGSLYAVGVVHAVYCD